MSSAVRYLDTEEAAKLTGESVWTIRRKMDSGCYRAMTVKGKSGKEQRVDVRSLPLEAQVRHVMQGEGCRIEDADLVGYQERYGEQGMRDLLERRRIVYECMAIDRSGEDVTRRKAELAAKHGVTVRTLYRWIKDFESNGTAGLMLELHKPSKGQSKGLCPCAQDIAKSYLMQDVKRTNKSVYKRLCKLREEAGPAICTHRCVHCDGSLARREAALGGYATEYELCTKAGDGLQIPSYSAFNRWAASLPEDQLAYARHGARYWEANYMPKAQRTKPVLANECWFGDHHMFDLFVVDDDGCIVRPWMTAWSDAASGCFVGWCITTNPNSTTIAETFVRAIPRKANSPFWGVPNTLYIDNGKDYRSKRFEGEREAEHVIGHLNERIEQTGLLPALGVSVIHAQPYKAWSKIIERLFGTLESCYIRELPGWCGNSPANRPQDLTRAKLERMAAQGKLLTLREFERILRETIIPAYHAERVGREALPPGAVPVHGSGTGRRPRLGRAVPGQGRVRHAPGRLYGSPAAQPLVLARRPAPYGGRYRHNQVRQDG